MAEVVRVPRRIRIMHVVDSLSLGGAERMAVNLANLFVAEGHEVHVCTTRRAGPLEELLDPAVGRLHLERTSRLDLRAIGMLSRYVKRHKIDILHAHGTSVFGAAAGAWSAGCGQLVWHVHYGAFASEGRIGLPYRVIRGHVSHTLTASVPLRRWVTERLGFDSRSVTYLQNFILPSVPSLGSDDLPGERGGRVVCVANFSRAKDHRNLAHAMRRVADRVPSAHLLLVGGGEDTSVASDVRKVIDELGLSDRTSFMGKRTDVPSLLTKCDVGVLSSIAEGLPLALLECGQAALAVVTTDVGQCADVVAYGSAGIVVQARDAIALGDAILQLLQSPELRQRMGAALQSRVRDVFNPDAALRAVSQVYDNIAR